ncbi:MAG: hypothetical protein IT558_02005 [Alphaproteobacteria bacterium]|nr:hypothetical protein [Alphaproteobacteria bacterium]
MTNVSTIGQALDQIERIKRQEFSISQLTTQLATGKKTQVFSGLNTEVLLSQRARTNFKSLTSYIDNLTNAERRIKQTTTALDAFRKQATDLFAVMQGFSQQSVHQKGDRIFYDDPLTATVENTQVGMTDDEIDVDFSVLRNMAVKAYDFFIDIVNSQENGRYLFGGAETTTKPLNDSGTLDAAVSVLITGWKGGTITSSGLIDDLQDRTTTSNPDALTDTIVGYSAALSAGNAGNVFIHADAGVEIDYTTLGNDAAFRDLIVAAGYLKSETLPPMADAYIPPNAYPGVPDTQGAPGTTLEEMKDNFFQVFNAITGMVSDALDRIDQLEYTLDNALTRVSEIKDTHKDTQNLLLDTVGEVEDIDTSEIAVKINTLQIQLQASLAITASSQQLSLVNFLAIR